MHHIDVQLLVWRLLSLLNHVYLAFSVIGDDVLSLPVRHIDEVHVNRRARLLELVYLL